VTETLDLGGEVTDSPSNVRMDVFVTADGTPRIEGRQGQSLDARYVLARRREDGPYTPRIQ
jgi:hypothetical protein